MLTKNDIKYLCSLNKTKFRRENGEALIEGKRLIDECIESAFCIRELYLTEKFNEKNKVFIKEINSNGIPLKLCSCKDMERISNQKQPPGIAAKIQIKPLKKKFQLKKNVLYLDKITDPGNLGTLFRTASWFGYKQILISENCTDIWNPKVVRSAAGAHFHLDFHFIDMEDIKRKGKNHIFIGADINGIKLSDFKLPLKKIILVLGNEAHGISRQIQKLLNHKITITGSGKPESLNVAVAGGIIMNYFNNSNT